VYAYHNTVHTATGTPHHLLFGWQPRDPRVPLIVVPPSDHPDVDAWLEKRSVQLKDAHASLEDARQSMIAARHADAKAHVYHPGDMIKVSSRLVLPRRAPSTQVAKLQPRWIGPFTVKCVDPPGANKVVLPATYSLVHDTLSVDDIRPWLSHESHSLESDFPDQVSRTQH
jgi:hypothetical protein